MSNTECMTETPKCDSCGVELDAETIELQKTVPDAVCILCFNEYYFGTSTPTRKQVLLAKVVGW